MYAFLSDLEGVWVPEVWINVAKKTGIEDLKLTTRDIQDYDVLMNHRIKILKEHNLTLKDIQNVIATIEPLEGAKEMLDWVRSVAQIHIVSDTFVEFADPLMNQLGRPSLFCNNLTVSPENMVTGYNLRQKDQKREVVKAFKTMQYQVVAFGDSYNDISMLKEADAGILFRPPQNVMDDFPQFPVVTTYDELKKLLLQYI
ncbi:MAG: bifunctional phosphoserine phosphatase/homoserine phosphotransferase ThrH [Bacteroidota bacterium]|nr:bifunctional phosphoserine phosphatase/homoserine phosphotransferase ThrH [Bacteroidota bacterium]